MKQKTENKTEDKNHDLIVIDRQLRSRKHNSFPLTPTHRKELRQIISKNIGDLRIKIDLISHEKYLEFIAKNEVKFDKIKTEQQKKVDFLMTEFNKMRDKVAKEIENFIVIESETNYIKDIIRTDIGYSDISRLNIKSIEVSYRKYAISDDKFNNYTESKFKEVFKDKTQKIYNMIDLYSTKYEEAIVFGDLLLVKDIYYHLKQLETDIEKLRKVKV